MKLFKCEVTNFGSYHSLELDLNDAGLGIIYGPTGSGKSTIPDMACWVLFGETAKGGAVDEVRSWLNPGVATTGRLCLEVNGYAIIVTRVRGRSNENDLYWTDYMTGVPLRGKDIYDTQSMLNKLLGVDVDLYLTAAYFSEFSPTGQFFMAKAKERRAILERVAALDFPVQLSQRIADARKTTKKVVEDLDSKYNRSSGKLEQLDAQYESALVDANEWQKTKETRIEELRQRKLNFENEKAAKIAITTVKYDSWQQRQDRKISDINAELDKSCKNILTFEAKESYEDDLANLKNSLAMLTAECPECGQPTLSSNRSNLQKKIQIIEEKLRVSHIAKDELENYAVILGNLISDLNPYISAKEDAYAIDNHYELMIAAKDKERNPFEAQLLRLVEERAKQEVITETLNNQYQGSAHRLTALFQLSDLTNDLRGQLLLSAVKSIEKDTNDCFEKYFDSELRVQFALKGSDDLEVTIHKNGYECVYSQLSKGQRQLLKLSFCTSVMKAASNRSGVHFPNLWFDEALDGLDSEMKLKAFSLFQDLQKEHESIFVVDHSTEFQALFDTKYRVSMESDASQIEMQND